MAATNVAVQKLTQFRTVRSDKGSLALASLHYLQDSTGAIPKVCPCHEIA